MSFKTSGDEVWGVNKGDWLSSKYYDKEMLLKETKRRNLIFISSFIVYLILSAILILF